MRKRLMLIPLIVFLVLCGCGKENHPISSKAVSCGQQAASTITDYLDGELSYDIASSRISKLSTEMKYTSDESSDIETHLMDSKVYMHILGISTDLTYDNFRKDSSSYDKLKDDVKNLLNDIE